MNVKIVLSLFGVIFVAGCSSQTIAVSSTPANSSDFSQAGTIVEQQTDEEIKALDFNTAPKGASLANQTLFGLKEASLTMNQAQKEHQSYTVKSEFNGQLIEFTTVGPDLNLHVEAATNVKDQALVITNQFYNATHGTILQKETSKTNGTSAIVGATMTVGDLDATYAVSSVGSKSTYTVEFTNRSSTPRASSETGKFTYTGTATLVMDDTIETVYDSNALAMEVNFAENTGTFSADTFTSNDANKVVSLNGTIALNNTDGSIIGSGTINVAGLTEDMLIFGNVANDNKSVVGSLVTDGLAAQTGGVKAGVFGVTGAVDGAGAAAAALVTR